MGSASDIFELTRFMQILTLYLTLDVQNLSKTLPNIPR